MVAVMRAPGATGTTGRAAATGGAIGERRLEHALQLGGLVAGQLAAGNFAIYEVVDLRLEIAGLVAVDA